jgi:hypothetical protein
LSQTANVSPGDSPLDASAQEPKIPQDILSMQPPNRACEAASAISLGTAEVGNSNTSSSFIIIIITIIIIMVMHPGFHKCTYLFGYLFWFITTIINLGFGTWAVCAIF